MKTYLEEDAALIYSCLPSEATPPDGSEDLFLLYALLMRAKGVSVEASDVHDAWSTWMLIGGRSHVSLRPYDALDSRIQREDTHYVTAIKRAADIRGSSQST